MHFFSAVLLAGTNALEFFVRTLLLIPAVVVGAIIALIPVVLGMGVLIMLVCAADALLESVFKKKFGFSEFLDSQGFEKVMQFLAGLCMLVGFVLSFFILNWVCEKLGVPQGGDYLVW
jgi:hypothetical protein